MQLLLRVNETLHEIEIAPGDSLLKTLRRLGFFGVKFGDEHGQSGSDTVLLDGRPVNAGLLLAAQAEGHTLETIEALSRPGQTQMDFEPYQVSPPELHPLQRALVESGAIQCGYCTPAQILTALSLLRRNPAPSEAEVREALSGVLCRCTGYLKPVEAVLCAAQNLRASGQIPPSPERSEAAPNTYISGFYSPSRPVFGDVEGNLPATTTATHTLPQVFVTPQAAPYQRVGKPEIKVDAVKLVQGKPAFAADLELRGLLYAKVLPSPHAHARIRRIDTARAKALPGVAAVLTWQDLPRVVFSTAGQSDPIPGPLDSFSLDNKVRFVGDRVATVAAESPEIAEAALKLIEVEYEPLEAVPRRWSPAQPASTMSRNT
jgi:putative selenate reductase molybdopterin-binding subunit